MSVEKTRKEELHAVGMQLSLVPTAPNKLFDIFSIDI
jgi:hypothetical protein